MNDTKNGRQPLWYTRHQGALLGPYPSSGIRRFLLLGRLSLDDEVSGDGAAWVPLRSVAELVPREVREALERGDADALLPARLREDERTGHDRRDEAAVSGADRRRRKGERRRDETALETRHRAAREALQEQLRQPRRFPLVSLSVAGMLVVSAIGFGLIIGAPDGPAEPDCASSPGPGVVWRNCVFDTLELNGGDLRGSDISSAVLRSARFSGSDLSGTNLQYSDFTSADLSYSTLGQSLLKGARLTGADLSYSDLTGADLSFSDLRGANIGGATLQGARLDRAIWIDGRLCAPGSLGGCRSE